MSDASPILILGPGRMAHHIIDHFAANTPHRVEGFVYEPGSGEAPDAVEGLPVYAIDEISGMAKTHLALCYLGDPARREFVRKVEAMGFSFTSAIDPGARIERAVGIDDGAVIGDWTFIDHHCRIGRHCVIGTHSVVGHDCVLEDFVTILPGTMIGGAVHFGEGAFVGMGCRIRDGVRIGAGAVVGIGSVVVKDVPDGASVVGNPAKPLERRNPRVFGSGFPGSDRAQ